jgi:hypothetical protein
LIRVVIFGQGATRAGAWPRGHPGHTIQTVTLESLTMMFVVDPAAAGRALAGGLLSCPECGGRLGPWSHARTRRVRDLDGEVTLTPDRGRCRACRRTQVLLPAFTVPRRAYTADVIGTVLLGGRPDPVPMRTATGWRTAVRRAAPTLTRQAADVAFAGATTPEQPAPRTRRPVSPLEWTLDALGLAARAVVDLFTHQPTPLPGPITGVDYLGLLTTRYRAEFAHRLRLADPDHAGQLGPWHAVTVATAGQLLTAR